MSTEKKTDDMTVDEMRTAIAALTGRPCVSKNATHLRKRLDDLRSNQAAAKKAQGTTTVVSISMHGRAKAAAVRIAHGEGIGVSELVRKALADYAQRNGHKGEVSNFEVSE